MWIPLISLAEDKKRRLSGISPLKKERGRSRISSSPSPRPGVLPSEGSTIDAFSSARSRGAGSGDGWTMLRWANNAARDSPPAARSPRRGFRGGQEVYVWTERCSDSPMVPATRGSRYRGTPVASAAALLSIRSGAQGWRERLALPPAAEWVFPSVSSDASLKTTRGRVSTVRGSPESAPRAEAAASRDGAAAVARRSSPRRTRRLRPVPRSRSRSRRRGSCRPRRPRCAQWLARCSRSVDSRSPPRLLQLLCRRRIPCDRAYFRRDHVHRNFRWMPFHGDPSPRRAPTTRRRVVTRRSGSLRNVVVRRR